MGSRLESKSTAVRKAIESHGFDDEEGEEYEGSKFGGFPEYFRRKKIKLQNLDAELRAHSADKPKIFKGIVCHVNGYTQPSLNDLHTMIVSHGGGFIQYLDGKTQVTHIIASSLTPKKIVDFRKYRIVKPAWIVDSIDAGRLLPWHNYSVVDEGRGQKLLQLDNGKVSTQMNNKQRGYRDQTDTSWYTTQLTAKDAGADNSDSQHRTLSGPDEPADEDAEFGPVSSSIEERLAKLAEGQNDRSPNEAPANTRGSEGVSQDQQNYLSNLSDDDDELYRLTAFQLPDEGPAVNVDAVRSSKEPGESRSTPPIDDNVNEGHDTRDPQTQPRNLLSEHVPLDMQDEDGEIIDLKFMQRPAKPEIELRQTGHSKHSAEDELFSEAKRAKMTAEEHNSWLLSDPRIRKSSTLNPEFLEQYYRESRLHHLSTWKADLKSQLQAMTAEQSSSQRERPKQPPGSRRYILHVDFDSFFVAVSLKKYPQFVDKPAVVAHGGGSGSEIASCNYPARGYGISNGMWMKKALDMCKDLKILPYDFPEYEAASKLFYDAILATGGVVQSVSIDEALIDATDLCLPAGGHDGVGIREGSIWREQQKADGIAEALRDRVKKDTGCAVSVGIGGNILLAKVALRKAKPAGQHQILPEDALDFIGGLQVQSLPGVAWSIGGKLEEIGVKYVKDIRALTKERLANVLGPKTGEKIWNYSRAIDKTEVGDQVTRKSVSAEVNWGVRFETQEQAEEFLANLCGELQKRLLKERVRGKQLTMKIMRRAADAPLDPPKHLGHGKCDTFNKSLVLGVATNDKDIIAKEVISILRGFGFSPGELRGLGVQMTRLEPIKPANTGGDAKSSQKLLSFKPAQDSAANSNVPLAIGEQHPSQAAQVGKQDRLHFQSAPKFASSSARNLQTPAATHRPPAFASRSESSSQIAQDAIKDESPATPRKKAQNKATAAISNIFRGDSSPSRKPLNTLGTQFVLPTQVDQQVLNELPEDIRARLFRDVNPARRPITDEAGVQQMDSVEPTRSGLNAYPPESQLDPDILAALPSSVRAEVMAQYNPARTIDNRTGDQTVLPQSPRKNRTINLKKSKVQPRSLLNASRYRTNDTPTLTQANFITAASRSRATSVDPATTTDSDAETHTTGPISDEFLAALPPDIKAEVLANHRAAQLRAKSRLQVPTTKPRAGRGRPLGARNRVRGFATHDPTPQLERVVKLPADPPRPTFTSRKLSEKDDLREAVSAWVNEFGEEGPYEEDRDALAAYLTAVVREEKDLDKAVGVVKWMMWTVDSIEAGKEKWKVTLEYLRKIINDCVRDMGLGAISFE